MIDNFLRRPRGVAEYIADALRVIGALSVVAAAVWLTWTDAGIVAFTLPGLLAPRFLGLRAGFDIVYQVTLLTAAWSNIFDLYRTVPGWDLVIHVVATMVLTVALYLLLARYGIVPPNASTLTGTLVLATALALAISALWEMVEWAGFTFITDDIFVTYDDTIGDMMAGGVGGLAAGILLGTVRLLREPDDAAARLS